LVASKSTPIRPDESQAMKERSSFTSGPDAGRHDSTAGQKTEVDRRATCVLQKYQAKNFGDEPLFLSR
jgi:hypothetical protein